jgi:ABC-2 type transport system permease protein/lipopolysaccharide transport system permease protein
VKSANRVLDAPPPELAFKRKVRLRTDLRELWGSRGMIRTLTERDLRVRYKQAVLGFLWAVLSPFVLMVVFTLFFQRIAQVDTGGVPYPLFAYLGLVPWGFFSSSVSSGGTSILSNISLLNKVYCPREVFPLASIGVAAADTAIASLVLVVVFAMFTVAPPLTAFLWLPLLLSVLVAFTVGVALIVSATIVYFRDLRQAIPLLLQLGLFATPIAYGMEYIPEQLQVIYSIVNPVAPVIDGLRRTFLYHQSVDLHLLGPAAISSMLILAGGYLLFKRLETRFADVA